MATIRRRERRLRRKPGFADGGAMGRSVLRAFAVRTVRQMLLFTLKEVVIGIGFHWQRRRQVFRGALEPIGRRTGYGRQPYRRRRVSRKRDWSEMNASASPELLKAHAVTGAVGCWRRSCPAAGEAFWRSPRIVRSDDEERIRWYDREDHSLFDVCADDHCQRYQGLPVLTNIKCGTSGGRRYPAKC